MMLVYYFLVILALVVAGPFLLLQPKARAGLKQKLGFPPAELKKSFPPDLRRVWFHAVSVGEFNAVLPLLKVFRQAHPEYHICVSTTTATGQKLALEKAGDFASIFYFPLDLPLPINRWLDTIDPCLVAVAETEIWPGFIFESALRGIPVCQVNGRISPRSFKKYLLGKPLIAPTFKRFKAIATQSDQETLRYLALGAAERSVFTCGNLKFDGSQTLGSQQTDELREALKLRPEETVIIGGSTHEGEEIALINAWQKLKVPSRLILAPRHPERFDRVASLIESAHFLVRRFSLQESFEGDRDIFLLDTIGKLTSFYAIASIAYVGGTLVRIGGHNLMEPYAWSCPVICGPHVEKTRDTASLLLSRQALVMVHDEQELAVQLSHLAASPSRQAQLGAAGKAVLSEAHGAVERTMSVLDSVLAGASGSRSSGKASGRFADLQPLETNNSLKELDRSQEQWP